MLFVLPKGYRDYTAAEETGQRAMESQLDIETMIGIVYIPSLWGSIKKIQHYARALQGSDKKCKKSPPRNSRTPS